MVYNLTQQLTVAITFNTAANAKSLSAFVIPVFSATALTKSAFLKLTTSDPSLFLAGAFFLAAFFSAYRAERDKEVVRDGALPFSNCFCVPLDGLVLEENEDTVVDSAMKTAAAQTSNVRQIIIIVIIIYNLLILYGKLFVSVACSQDDGMME